MLCTFLPQPIQASGLSVFGQQHCPLVLKRSFVGNFSSANVFNYKLSGGDNSDGRVQCDREVASCGDEKL